MAEENPFLKMKIKESSDNPFSKMKKSDPDSEESEGFIQEIGEGIVSGLTKIPQGVLELGATGIDLIAGTEKADAVTEAFEGFREAAGIDPTGFAGKAAEVVTQFGVPGGFAVKGLNSLAKARKIKALKAGQDVAESSKLKKLAEASAAAGAADFMVATNDTEGVIENFFDGQVGPEEEAGMSGRLKAFENIKDRLSLGVEGAIAVPAAMGVIKAVKSKPVQATKQAVAESAIAKPILQEGAQFVLKGTNKVSDAIAKLDDTVLKGQGSTGQNALSAILGGLRYRGRLPFEIGQSRNLNKQGIKVDMTRAERNVTLLEKDIDNVVKELDQNASPLAREKINLSIKKYLTAEPNQLDEIYSEIPDAVGRKNLNSMRKHVLDLSKDAIENSAFLRGGVLSLDGVNLKDMIAESIAGNKGYLRRDYEIHRNKNYTPTEESKKVAKQFFKTGGSSKESFKSARLAEEELTKAFQRQNDLMVEETGLDFNDAAFLKSINAEKGLIAKAGTMQGEEVIRFVNGKVNDEAAEAALKAFIDRHSNLGARNVSRGRIASVRLNTDMLLERKNIAPELRKVMGEIDNPTQAYLQTINDLASFKAADTFFDDITRLAKTKKGIGRLFIDGNTLNDAAKADLQRRGYVQLGEGGGESFQRGELLPTGEATKITTDQLNRSGWGTLSGYLVPKQIYSDLSVLKLGNDQTLDNLASQVINTAMKAKGITQYSKTVLSPITQGRNLTSASMFAVMQGNVGRGANLKESFDIVLKNMRNAGDDEMLKELAEMQTRGIIGTSANLREIQELLGGYGAPTFKGYVKGERNLAIKKAKEFTNLADKLYQGSDDGWKIYNYKFEQNKLRDALKNLSVEDQYKHLTGGKKMPPGISANQIDELIKDQAGSIVRNTVPNYDLAPDAVRFTRKIPFGNFVTFPYEVYRTGFNTIDQAMKELASDIPGVRNIGLRRLSGAITTTTIAPIAAVQAGMLATGIGQDQIDAYKRSFGAPWEKSADLIPIGLDKDGHPQFVNFSTFNPYNDIRKVANSAMDSYTTSRLTGKDMTNSIGNAMFKSMTESMKPFMEPSMVFKATLEGNPFGDGKSSTGARIFNQEDSMGEKIYKGGLHMANTGIPNVVPFQTQGGVVAPRKIIRSTLGTEDGIIDSMDKQGNVYSMDRATAMGILGFRPITFKPENNLKYKGFELSGRATDAKRKFTSLADDKNIDSQTLLQGYIDANNSLKNVDEQVYQMFEDGRKLGLSDSKMRRILKNEGVKVSNKVMRGEFDPYRVSSSVKTRMRRSGILDKLPREQINNLYQQFRKEKLTTDPEFIPATPSREFYTPEPESNPFSNMKKSSAVPLTNPFNNMNISTPVAQPINRTNLSPSLLGDPRNADILNRSS